MMTSIIFTLYQILLYQIKEHEMGGTFSVHFDWAILIGKLKGRNYSEDLGEQY
jgi:hypothetical protein